MLEIASVILCSSSNQQAVSLSILDACTAAAISDALFLCTLRHSEGGAAVGLQESCNCPFLPRLQLHCRPTLY